KLIRVDAHLKGGTNYKQSWEDLKEVIFNVPGAGEETASGTMSGIPSKAKQISGGTRSIEDTYKATEEGFIPNPEVLMSKPNSLDTGVITNNDKSSFLQKNSDFAEKSFDDLVSDFQKSVVNKKDF